MKLFSKILLLLPILVILSCTNVKKIKKQPVEKQYEIANQLFEKGKYRKAKEVFENITFLRNSKFTADAHYKSAMCEFNQKNYADARFQFNQIKSLFSDYDKINEVYFKIGECFYLESEKPDYTQEETIEAAESFQKFLEKFPYDEKKKKAIEFIQKCNKKLLEKKYINGYIYYKISDYSAALYHFDELIKLGNNNEIDKKAYYYSVLIYIARDNKEFAENFLETMKNKYPESKKTKNAEEKFNKKFK